MITNTRRREYREGWLGRRRKYVCRECRVKFQVDTLNPLPEIDRVCIDCRKRTQVFIFIDKRNGREKPVRASSAELATLRAWSINKHLTFKIPQESQS